MYKIVARMTIKKDKIEEFKKTAEELIKKSNAAKQFCLDAVLLHR